jgi:hypothetical protein
MTRNSNTSKVLDFQIFHYTNLRVIHFFNEITGTLDVNHEIVGGSGGALLCQL